MRRALLTILFPLTFSLPLLASALSSHDVRLLLAGSELDDTAHNRATFAMMFDIVLFLTAVLGHAVGHLLRYAILYKGERVNLDQLSDRSFAQLHVVAGLAAWLGMAIVALAFFAVAPILQALGEFLMLLIPILGPSVSTFAVITFFLARKPQAKVPQAANF